MTLECCQRKEVKMRSIDAKPVFQSRLSFFLGIKLLIACLIVAVVKAESAVPTPDFYDDFSDGKVTARTGIDPWGRPLPEWKGDTENFDASGGYLICTDGYYHSIHLDSNITKGTWEFRMRFPQGCLAAPQSYVYLKPLANSSGEFHQLTHKNDNHVYFLDSTQKVDSYFVHLIHGGTPGSFFTYGVADNEIPPAGNCSFVDDQWHTVKVIRKTDGVTYIFQDDLSVWNGPIKTNEINTDKFILTTMYSEGHSPFIDEVKVYDGIYLFPPKEIIYNAAENRIILHSGADNPRRLQEIALAIGDNSVFEYHDGTKTAISHAHIQMRGGAALLIEGETLQFDTETSFLELRLFRSAEIYIYNSTITTSHHNPFEFLANHDFIIQVDNSVLNNVSVYWHNPNDMFENFVKHTRINIFGYFRLANGIPKNIMIEKNTFSATSPAAMIAFERSGENPNVSEGDGNKMYKTETIIQDNIFNNLEVRSQYGRMTQLINCDLAGTAYLYPRSTGDSGNYFVVKYYLDVKVVDENDNPVSEARVTVTNEADNNNYPAQNVQIVTADDYPEEQNANWGPYNDAMTGIDGHTALPHSTLNSLVITDFKQSWDIGITKYTYTIRVEKNGYMVEATGVAPDAKWYRADPNIYPGEGMGTVVLKLPILTETDGFTVSPNPYIKSKSTGEKIIFGNLPQTANIKIYSLSGDLIKSINHKSETDTGFVEWNVSKIASGIYLYSIFTSQKKARGKLSIIK